jgi:hypothetical protein
MAMQLLDRTLDIRDPSPDFTFPIGDCVAMQISPGPSFSKRGIKNKKFLFFKGG